MKKILIFSLTLLLFSCGASKNVRSKEKTIKGNWTLTNVNYSNLGNYKITLFQDESKECFEGSEWRFIPNNNTGTYSIQKTNCNAGIRDFVFVIQETDAATGYFSFLLKPDDNENNIGYKVELKELTENTMLWQQNLTVDGKLFLINMKFIKQ
ncbi:MAG: lipocalin family protein [Polaribacter sp.]|uniref:lipocalin family protein n=1 Tax=Polaribacter sp. TaxID=1920175 RepID=UPI003BB2241F